MGREPPCNAPPPQNRKRHAIAGAAPALSPSRWSSGGALPGGGGRPGPGLRGANRTGRPFTGDYAGELLFATLAKFGFTRGTYGGESDDGFELIDVRIPSAVRCVPPQNIAAPEEIRTCNRFLKPWISRSPRLKAVVALGQVGHTAVIMAAGARQAAHKFGHGAEHDLGAFRLFDSYHCSRRNTNTGTLTTAMFEEVFARVRRYIDRND